MASSEDLAERLSFLRFDDQDRNALAELRPLMESHADQFVTAFYRHLLSFSATRALLTDPQVKTRLLDEQREYLLSLVPPTLDDNYMEGRRRIGRTHQAGQRFVRLTDGFRQPPSRGRDVGRGGQVLQLADVASRYSQDSAGLHGRSGCR